MIRKFLLSLILIFFLLPKSGISQERTDKKDVDQIKKLESKIDSLLAITYTSSNRNEIYSLYKEAQDNIVLANRIIDYSAMLFGAITVMFIIAAILGTTEFSRIRKMRRRINRELKIIQNRRKSGEKSIEIITSQLDILSKNIISIISNLSEGRKAYESGYYDTSIQKFKNILVIENLHPFIISNINYLIGLAYSANGKFEEAESAFNQSLKYNLTSFEAYYGLAINYRNKPDFDLNKAIGCCEKAIKINPDYNYTFNILGLICRDNNDLVNSLKNHELAWKKTKEATTAFFIALLHLKQGNTQAAKSFIDETTELANQSIENGRRLHWMNHVLGVVEILNNNYADGIIRFKTALGYNKSQMVKNAMIGHLEFISDIIIEKIGKEKYDSIIKLFQ